MDNTFEFLSTKKDNKFIFKGKMSCINTSPFNTVAKEVIHDLKDHDVIIDFTGTDFLNSTGIKMIIDICKAMKENKIIKKLTYTMLNNNFHHNQISETIAIARKTYKLKNIDIEKI